MADESSAEALAQAMIQTIRAEIVGYDQGRREARAVATSIARAVCVWLTAELRSPGILGSRSVDPPPRH